MKRPLLLPFLLALAAPLLGGCMSHGGMMLNAFVVGVAVAHASDPPPVEATPVDEPDPEPRIESVPVGPQAPVDLQPHPATARVPRPFDLGGAYAAMSRVELTACKEAGIAPGYMHVDLELEPDGSVGSVAVQLHAATAAARSCVQHAFAGVRVEPFDGDQPVHVQRDVFVR
jgi:hypothetical protein